MANYAGSGSVAGSNSPSIDYGQKIREALAGGNVESANNYAQLREAKRLSDPVKYKDVKPTSSFFEDAGYNYGNNTGLKSLQMPIVTDNSALIAAMYDQQAQQQGAAIRAARDRQVSDYNYQISQAPQQYQGLKDEASLQGAKTGQQIREAMAYSGLGNSGKNISAQVANDSATNSRISGYNVSQQNLVSSLRKAINDAQSAASEAELSSNAQIAGDKIKASIDERNRIDTLNNTNYWNGKNFGLSEAGVTGTYNGTPTLQKQQQDVQNAWNAVNATGAVDENSAKILGIPVGTQTLQAQEFAWSRNANNPAVKAQILGNTYQQLQNDIAELEKRNLPAKQKAELEQIRAQTKAALDNSSARVANAQIAQINAETARIKAETAANKIDTSTTNTVDDYAAIINSIYVQKPNSQNGLSTTVIDNAGIKAYIDSLIQSLPDTPQNNALIDQLAARYGIK